MSLIEESRRRIVTTGVGSLPRRHSLSDLLLARLTKQPYDPNKRFQPYFRKAIPKRTTLAGRIAHEVNCVAVENAESERLLAERTLEAMRPKMHTKFIRDGGDSIAGKGFIQPGTIGAQSTFKDFIVRLFQSPMKVILTLYRKPREPPVVTSDHNYKRQPVCRKTIYWTGFSTVSENTTTGP